MGRVLALLYGIIAYVVFLVAFLYAIAFVGNLVVAKTIDTGPAGGVGAAVLVNILLLGLFAVQHSVMARPGFKRAWTKLVPPPVERSTYVLLASLVLLLLYWQWRPLPATVWDVRGSVLAPVLNVLFWAGWGLVLVSTFLINHFDLFGLRQVSLYLSGRPYPSHSFKQPGLYKYVRHPIMVGFLIAFWSAAHMSVGRLLFAAVTTAYILIAIRLEERDLVTAFGESYQAYRRQVGMIIPGRRRT